GVEQVLARKAAAVGYPLHRAIAGLGRHDPVLAVTGHRFADDLLGAATVVYVGGVDEVDALVPGLVDDAQGVLGAGLLAEHHAAEGEGRDLEATLAEGAVDHGEGP